MNKLPDAKNRAKKAARGNEYTYKAVLGSLRRDCAEPNVTLYRLVRVPEAPPPAFIDLYGGEII